MHAHAETIRQDGRFAEVAVGLLTGGPSADDALSSLAAAEVRVVPFFMEDGYFTRVAVPRALSGHATSTRAPRLCPPVGTHPAIASVIARRAVSHCTAHGLDPKGVALLLVGHGSAWVPGRRKAAHDHAERLAAQNRFGPVRVAFLEEPPFVPDTLADLRGMRVAVLGLFAGDGGHVRDDLPAVIAADQDAADTVLDLGIIGTDPALAGIIMDQAGRPRS